MRTPVIAANWKMYKTNAETRQFIADFEPLVKDVRDVEIILAPPFTSLSAAARQVTLSFIRLSAQNAFYEKQGAFTGEISPQMVKECGCSHVIAGHSERRQYFGESDAVINRKIKAAQEAGLVVIFCVGETLAEREAGKTLEVISRQVREGLEDIDFGRLIVAYEPVWAIGTGKNATPEQAQEVHGNIRNLLKELGSNAGDVRILYGGSVKPDNIGVLMQKDDIDGALVGGASLDPVSFSKIVKY